MAAGNCVEETACREQKHILLRRSVKNLERICDRYESFHRELNGDIIPESIKTTDLQKEPESSFANVLSSAPNSIHEIIGRFEDYLNKLRETIL